MSKHADELKTVILEHDRALQIYEARLDEMEPGSRDSSVALIRSQIEFFALNVRSMKLNHERELKRLLDAERHQWEQKAQRVDAEFQPKYSPVVGGPWSLPNVSELRVVPVGAFIVWAWSDAPEEMKKLGDQGGDEDFAAVLPKGVGIPSFLASWDYHTFELPDGSTLVVGTHA